MSLEEQAAAGVEHHGGEQQRQINDGGVQQIARGLAAASARRASAGAVLPKAMREKRMVYQR